MILIAWGKTTENSCWQQIRRNLVHDDLLKYNGNSRIQQRQKCRYLAYFLLKQLLQEAEISTALLNKIERTVSGRPHFQAEHVDFNISHSSDWVAVILKVSNKEQKSVVGIDIELPVRSRNYTALLTQFTAKSEQNWFEKQSNKEASFYRIWCLREAVLKSQGVGIAKLSSIEHNPLDLQINTPFCPQGELIFTSELPFYLAYFSNRNAQKVRYFLLQHDKLIEEKLNKQLKYQVN